MKAHASLWPGEAPRLLRISPAAALVADRNSAPYNYEGQVNRPLPSARLRLLQEFLPHMSALYRSGFSGQFHVLSQAAASIFARTSRGVQRPWRSTSHSRL